MGKDLGPLETVDDRVDEREAYAQVLGALRLAQDLFVDTQGPIQILRSNHQVIEAGVFSNIRDPLAITLVLQAQSNGATAHRAVHHNEQRSGTGIAVALSFPLDAPLRAFDVERLGLHVSPSRERF